MHPAAVCGVLRCTLISINGTPFFDLPPRKIGKNAGYLGAFFYAPSTFYRAFYLFSTFFLLELCEFCDEIALAL
jgi:hypothetical protein